MAWGLILLLIVLVPLATYAVMDLIEEIQHDETTEPFFPNVDGCDIWISRATRDKLQAAADALEDSLDDHEDLADSLLGVVSIWDWNRPEAKHETSPALRVVDDGGWPA